MLVGGSTFARHRVAFLLAAVGVFCLPAAAWYVAARMRLVDWPSGSTILGLSLGIAAAGIIAFEMLLWPRKSLRRFRLGKTRRWMFWHVWLGLASLPLAVGHAGFRFGGPLTTATLVVFLVVIASGIWGLAMQQILPGKLLNDFPTETVETQVPEVMAHHAADAAERVEAVTLPGDPLRSFFEGDVAPYLRHGRLSRSVMRSAARASVAFDDQRMRQPAASAVIDRLRALVEDRRRYDHQVRIHWWLHNWLLVHLPLSIALCALLAVHVFTAMKYW